MRSTHAVCLIFALAAGVSWCTVPAGAHGGKSPQQGQGGAVVGRYQLAKYWTGDEVRVLDRNTGRLFCLDAKADQALLIDALGGRSVTKPIQRLERRTVGSMSKPTWPTRDTTAGKPRFIGLGEHDPRAGSIEAGAEPAMFDPDTGRVYRIRTPVEVEIIDPVEGRITRCKLELGDGTKLAERMTRTRNEHKVTTALFILARAQLRFRDLDPEKDGRNDYGTLKELGEAKLISPELAAGTYEGYKLELRLGRGGTVYLAVASPVEPGKTGSRHFAVSERGQPYWRKTAIPLDADCRIPDDAVRVGP